MSKKFDILIIDDPEPDEPMSDEKFEALLKWFKASKIGTKPYVFRDEPLFEIIKPRKKNQ